MSPLSPPNEATTIPTKPEGHNGDEKKQRKAHSSNGTPHHYQEAEEDEDACNTDDESVDCDKGSPGWREQQAENDEEGEIIVLTPTENDIFCGRGRGIGSTPGNEKYIKLIGSKRAQYLELPKKEKQDYAEQVLRIIETEWYPPGRFLEYPVNDDADGEEMWKILSKKRIIVKICTALRKGPKSNNSRKRLQAAKRKKQLEQTLKHRSLIIPGTGEKSELGLQSPIDAREEAGACGDEPDDETKMRHLDAESPVSPRVKKRAVPSSSGNHGGCEIDARCVAVKTEHPSSVPNPPAPLSLKEGEHDQRAVLSSSVTSCYGVPMENKDTSSARFGHSSCAPAGAPLPCAGYSAPTTGRKPSEALKESLLAQRALTLPDCSFCRGDGIIGGMPATLLAGGVLPRHCICSRILEARNSCLPSLSLVPCLAATYMSSLSLAGNATLASPALTMPPPSSALFSRMPQLRAKVPPAMMEATVPPATMIPMMETMVPPAMMETMAKAKTTLQPARHLGDSNPLTFPVTRNRRSNLEIQQTLNPGALFFRTATQVEATTTFGGTSSVQRSRDSDAEKECEGSSVVSHLGPVASFPSKDATPFPLCHDVRTSHPPPSDPKPRSREPPLSPVPTEHKLDSTRRQQTDAGAEEVFIQQTLRPDSVLSCARMKPPNTKVMAGATASTNKDDRNLDMGEDDVFCDAEEDAVLDASHFQVSAAFTGKFGSSC